MPKFIWVMQINYVTSQNTYDAAVIALNNSMYIQSSPKYSIEKLESFNFANKYAEVALKNFDQDLVKNSKHQSLHKELVIKQVYKRMN